MNRHETEVHLEEALSQVVRDAEHLGFGGKLEYDVVIPSARFPCKLYSVNEVRLKPGADGIRVIGFMDHDFHVLTDFHDYKGRKNNRQDISEHLKRYKSISVHSGHRSLDTGGYMNYMVYYK